MPQYGMSFNPKKLGVVHRITVKCGVEDCRAGNPMIGLSESFVVRVLAGKGFMESDPRPRTPSGGRLGAPQPGRRMFIRTEKTHACVSCSLRYPVVQSERRPDRTWRVR